MSNDKPRDDAFAERIARPLRRAERADPTFEARAMSAVHAAARSKKDLGIHRSWWTRPRIVFITPLATMALAAGLIFVMASSLMVTKRSVAHVAARTDTVHVVRFVLVDSTAQKVHVVGGFNHWDQEATPLRGTSVPGVWSVSVPLSAGRHEYAFVVEDENGQRWVADPLAHRHQDEFDTESSVIFVGANTGS